LESIKHTILCKIFDGVMERKKILLMIEINERDGEKSSYVTKHS